jgi:serine/threonine-protein kinase
LPQIARELKVAHVVEGSVRASARSVRISARLIDARGDRHLWAENYEFKSGESFQVQEHIAQAVARALDVELGKRRGKAGTHDRDAYELYRRARALWSTMTKQGHEQAITYYRRAIERDSSYADAYAELADVYLASYQMSLSSLSEEDSYSRIKWAAERALALDDESAGAHTSLAVSLWWQRNWPGAEREIRRALELNPGNATARSDYALLLADMGRVEEALQQSRRASELDPFVASHRYAWACYIDRDYDCAIEQYRKNLEINNVGPPSYTVVGLAYAHKRMHEAAIREVSKGLESMSQSSWYLADCAYVHAGAGRMEESVQLLKRAKLVARSLHGQQYSEFNIARVHVALGEPDSAFAWLERSSWRWPHRAVRADPALDPLRADPRFAQLSARIEREMGIQ